MDIQKLEQTKMNEIEKETLALRAEIKALEIDLGLMITELRSAKGDLRLLETDPKMYFKIINRELEK